MKCMRLSRQLHRNSEEIKHEIQRHRNTRVSYEVCRNVIKRQWPWGKLLAFVEVLDIPTNERLETIRMNEDHGIWEAEYIPGVKSGSNGLGKIDYKLVSNSDAKSKKKISVNKFTKVVKYLSWCVFGQAIAALTHWVKESSIVILIHVARRLAKWAEIMQMEKIALATKEKVSPVR